MSNFEFEIRFCNLAQRDGGCLPFFQMELHDPSLQPEKGAKESLPLVPRIIREQLVRADLYEPAPEPVVVLFPLEGPVETGRRHFKGIPSRHDLFDIEDLRELAAH